jgi:hypothetical protein
LLACWRLEAKVLPQLTVTYAVWLMRARSNGVVVLLFSICCWTAIAAAAQDSGVINVSTDLELRQALLRSPQVGRQAVLNGGWQVDCLTHRSSWQEGVLQLHVVLNCKQSV